MSMSSLHTGTLQIPHMRIYPVTSVSTRRYEKTARVELSHTIIDHGSITRRELDSPSTPPNWAAYIHPEGQAYFVRQSSPRVVTEEYLYRSETLSRINMWSKFVEESLSQRGIRLPDTAEIFLQLDDDTASCGYYIIDHATRTQFWIDPVPTDSLDLPQVVSPSHLKLALEELYWNHLEYFPMHFNELPSRIVEDLISIICHGRADRMTSDYSTFPYTEEQCAKFIDLLRCSQGRVLDGHTICYVARLWGSMINHRFITHSGQEHSRLSRDQAILGSSTTECPWLSTISSRLLCGVPDIYKTRLDRLYIDEVLYIDQWRNFLPTCIEDWKSSVSWSFLSLLSTILLSTAPSSSHTIALSSILISGTSIVSGILLLLRHELLREACASEVAQYLRAVQSPSFGFLPVASLFSIPKAFCLWGFALFMSQAIIMTLPLVDPYLAVAAGILLFVLICAAGWCRSPAGNLSTIVSGPSKRLIQFLSSAREDPTDEKDIYSVV